ncbi:hypothetical protein ABES02_00340 [Neobacillus pocheonensis]|uniref:hypothetical protein n=1 Tax=Neobacillus pocheonensis TaxID=363869 RepID=UPI003D2D9B8E
MYQQKLALLKTYYQLTRQLLNEINDEAPEPIQALMNERQNCIEEINQLDRSAGQILINPALKELLQSIFPMEKALQDKLNAQKQKILANIYSLKKEKNIKQHYGEPAAVFTGLFYDKRK